MFGLIPLPYKIIAGLAAIALVFWAGLHEGYKRHKTEIDAQTLKTMISITKLYVAEVARGDDIAAKLEKEKQNVRTVTKVITRKVPEYISVRADRECVVPNGFRLLHDAYASGVEPEAPGKLVDAPSGISLSSVAATVGENYGTCLEWKAQLNSLIDWAEGVK